MSTIFIITYTIGCIFYILGKGFQQGYIYVIPKETIVCYNISLIFLIISILLLI